MTDTRLSELRLPDGACDCHVHVIGPQTDYPMVADRHYTPGPAGVDALRLHMSKLGVQRALIVQPSVYGFDNRCLLESLKRLDGAGRGIAVLPTTVDDAELDALHRQGIRGLRVNLESAGVRDPELIAQELDYWTRRVAHLGWHIQVYASLDAVAGAAPDLAKLSAPIVLDHFAMIPAVTPLDDARVQAVMALVRSGIAYVKLSAPYRVDADASAARQVAALAQAFIQTNPKQILWGSDWPHTNRESGKAPHEVSAYRRLASAELISTLHACLPKPQQRQQVLVDNPVRLYGF